MIKKLCLSYALFVVAALLTFSKVFGGSFSLDSSTSFEDYRSWVYKRLIEITDNQNIQDKDTAIFKFKCDTVFKLKASPDIINDLATIVDIYRNNRISVEEK